MAPDLPDDRGSSNSRSINTNIMIIKLDGQVPAQKNDKRIAINRRTGKPFPMTSPAVKAWQELVAWQLKALNLEPFTDRVGITYLFRVKDNRRRDLDNMEASINDAIVKAGIIVDDSWQWCKTDDSDAHIDKDNVGVTLTIRKV